MSTLSLPTVLERKNLGGAICVIVYDKELLAAMSVWEPYSPPASYKDAHLPGPHKVNKDIRCGSLITVFSWLRHYFRPRYYCEQRLQRKHKRSVASPSPVVMPSVHSSCPVCKVQHREPTAMEQVHFVLQVTLSPSEPEAADSSVITDPAPICRDPRTLMLSPVFLATYFVCPVIGVEAHHRSSSNTSRGRAHRSPDTRSS